MRFFVGIHHPSMGWPLSLRGFRVCISANSLKGRSGPAFVGADWPGWMMDSGAFTSLLHHGRFEMTPAEYAEMIRRFSGPGAPQIAVSQDLMCEPWILQRTGGTVASHQAETIARFDAVMAEGTAGVPVMPVLQGWSVEDYRRHLDDYGWRLEAGAWVGVGSVCKRQGDVRAIGAILEALLRDRPDLRLHGFGVKRAALQHDSIRDMLFTADSMAWSYAARFEGRDQNSWVEAARFALECGGCPEAVDILMRQRFGKRREPEPALTPLFSPSRFAA